MARHWLATLIIGGALVGGTAAWAAEWSVQIKNSKFSSTSLTIKVGDTVNFKNADTIVHHIFSLSEAEPFDLAAAPPGQSSPVTFDRPGTVEVECAIHPAEKMTVVAK